MRPGGGSGGAGRDFGRLNDFACHRELDRPGSGLLDPHTLQAVPKLLTVDAIAVAKEIGRRGRVRKGIHDLLGGPRVSGMLGHVEVNHASAMVSEHEENEEDTQAGGGYCEEIDGDQVSDVVRGASARSGRARDAASA
jgi:hypothetical protein